MLPDPAVAVTLPLHELVSPLDVATTKPVGSVSVKATPVSIVPGFGFEMMNVRVVVPPTGTLAAPKPLLITGGFAAPRAAVGGSRIVPSSPITVTAPRSAHALRRIEEYRNGGVIG